MFGIGLPEMIVIFAVALIVVGPDKLPGLARSLAKGLMEMKKTLEQVKENLTQEGEVLDSVQKDLKKTAEELREKMIDVDPAVWQPSPTDTADDSKETEVIDVQPITASPQEEKQPLADVPFAEINTEPGIAGQPSATSPPEGQQAAPPDKNHV